MLPLFHASSRNPEDQGGNANGSKRNLDATYYTNTPATCGGSSAFQAAAEYVGLIPRAGFGNSAGGGCEIDKHTELLWGDPATARYKGPKQLFQRPWATTPFMGGGDPDSVPDESKLIFGHSTANRKSINTVTDKQFPYFAPLLSEKIDDYSEYKHAVGPFDRGGIPTRTSNKTRVKLSN
jgi:hypothetical protein